MAQHEALAIIKKAASDEIFRNALSTNFDKTVETHQVGLTPEEHTALKAVDWKGTFGPVSGAMAAKWIHVMKS